MSNTGNDLIERTRELEECLVDPRSSISIDGLLDSVIALIYDAEGLRKTANFDAFYSRFHPSTCQIREKRIHADDFELVKILGRGAFGTVDLVRLKRTRQVFAMKTLSKFEMLKRSDSAFFWEERNIMAFSNSEWIVKLHYAFQDAKNLYMIMDYMAGGDLITLLNRYEITENWARFYCAEIIMSLDAVHSMGYIHRDVKPDNMLLDARGHLKLADFGTCIKMDKTGSVRSDTAVGTPDYISPEILKLQTTMGVYGREVDWWSVGVVLYEMLIGETPFYAESLVGTYHKITHHQTNLVFPEDVPMTPDARQFISALLCDRSTRLGKHGVAEIKAHPFFVNQNEWTWETIRRVAAPVVPTIATDDDTRNFEVIETTNQLSVESFSVSKTFVGNQLSFVGFSYSNEQQPFLNDRAATSFNNFSDSELEQRLQENERLKSDLEVRLRRLQDDLNNKCQDEQQLNSKIYDLERKNVVLTTEHKEAQRKYELELDNRQTLEQRLEEMQRSFDHERNRTDQMGANNRDSSEKIAYLEQQISELSDQLKIELESSTRLKKQNQDLQKSSLQYERTHTEMHDKYQNLIAIKLKLERDAQTQQALLEEERSVNFTAMEKLRELEEKSNMTTSDLLKSKDREAFHMNALAELRQSTASIEQEKADLQAALDIFRTKFSNEDGVQPRFREQILSDKSKRASTVNGAFDDIHRSSQEMIEALERKLDTERLGAKRLQEELAVSQKQVRILVADFKAINHDYEQLSNQWNDRLDSDRQRRLQYDRELRQLQEQLNRSVSREEQTQKDLRKLQKEKEFLDRELHRIRDEYETNRSKVTDYEEQIEVSSKFSGLYQTQMHDLKDEIADLTKKLRQADDERQHLQDQQYTLTQQLDAINEKSKKESSSLNILQERYAELEKEKQIMTIEVEALHTNFHTRIGLLDSEINSFRDRYEECQYNLDQAVKDRETMSAKLRHAFDQLHEQERQLPELRKKLESERVNKEVAITKLKELITNPPQANPFFSRANTATMSGRRHERSRSERNVLRRFEQALEEERMKYKKLQSDKEEEISVLTEENNRLRRDLDARAMDMGKSRKNTEACPQGEASGEIDVKPKTRLENWIQIPTRNIRKGGWKRQYGVLTKHRLVIYNSDKDHQATISIEFNTIYHARSVTQGDVLRVDPSMIPKIFQILYDSQGQAISNVPNGSISNSPSHSPEPGRQTGESIEYRGHSFVIMTYRIAAECESCNRPCHSLLSPPQCLVCTRCRFRCHKQHYDDGEDFVPSCRIYDTLSVKELLIMCASEHEQKQWVAILKTKIKQPALVPPTPPRNPPRSTNTSFRSLNSSISSLTSFNFGNPSSQSPSLKSSTLSTNTK